MSDLAYELLDELYFVISFDKLITKFEGLEIETKNILIEMIKNNWVNYYKEIEGEINPEMEINNESIEKLFFLASKKGLFAHNSK